MIEKKYRIDKQQWEGETLQAQITELPVSAKSEDFPDDVTIVVGDEELFLTKEFFKFNYICKVLTPPLNEIYMYLSEYPKLEGKDKEEIDSMLSMIKRDIHYKRYKKLKR